MTSQNHIADENEKTYSPLEALAEIEMLLDGVGNPDDPDDYVGCALKIARETVAAHAPRSPSMP